MKVADISWIGLVKIGVLVTILVAGYHFAFHRDTATAADLEAVNARIDSLSVVVQGIQRELSDLVSLIR